jgi:hypothetical protein
MTHDPADFVHPEAIYQRRNLATGVQAPGSALAFR